VSTETVTPSATRRSTVGVGDTRLPADVDEVRPLGDERQRVVDLLVERAQALRVGERVRVGVDDPHHQRAPWLDRDGPPAQAQDAHRLTA
jgi:hypothetical protein